jgi:hypothetical protein
MFKFLLKIWQAVLVKSVPLFTAGAPVFAAGQAL